MSGYDLRIGAAYAVAGLLLCTAVAFGAGADNRADYVYKALAVSTESGLVKVRIVEPQNTSLCNIGDYAVIPGLPAEHREFTVREVLRDGIILESVAKGFELDLKGTEAWLVTWSDVGRRWLRKLDRGKGKAVEEVLREAAEFRGAPKKGGYKDAAYRLTRREVDAVWSSVPLNDKLIENYKKAFDRDPPAVTGTLVVNNTGEVPLKVEIGGQTGGVKPHQSVELSVTAGVKHSVKYEPTGENADDFNAGEKEVMVPIEGKMATVSLAAKKKADLVLSLRNTGEAELRVTVRTDDAKVDGGAFDLAKGEVREMPVPPNASLKVSYEPAGTRAYDDRKGEDVQVTPRRDATAAEDLAVKLKGDPVLTLRNTGAVALRVTVQAGGKDVGQPFNLVKGASQEVTVPPRVALKVGYEPTGTMADDYLKGEEVHTIQRRGVTETKDLQAKLKPDPVLTLRNTGEVALKVTVQAGGKAVGQPFNLVKGASQEVTVPPRVALKVGYEPTGTMADDYLKGEEVHTIQRRGVTETKDLQAKLKPDPVLTLRNAGEVALRVTVQADGKAVGEAFELAKGASREVSVPPNVALRAVYEPTGTLADDYLKGVEVQAALKRGAAATRDLQAKLKPEPVK